MAKKTTLTEKQIDDLFIVAAGFNLTDAETGEETRFDAGTDKKPHFVTENDFSADDWKELKKQKAVVLFEKPETEAGKDEIVLEIFGE